MVLINPKNYVDDNKEAAFIPMEKIEATYLSSYTYTVRKWREIKSGYTHFADGDVAFAKITPCFQNRKSMILNNLPNGIGAGTTELKVLRPYRNTLSVEYLLFFLESPYFVEEAVFKGTANQQRIISGYLENKLFPLPPLNEQRRIAEKIKKSIVAVEQYGKVQDKLEDLNNNLNTLLKKSVLQEAIQGKLVPQDPNDEPASVLLQRIKEEKKRLVKEGRMKKKDIVDSIIYKGDDNKYYEQVDGTAIQIESDYDFPNTWAVVKLSHICRLIDGEKKEGQHICLEAKYLRGKSTGTYLDKGKFVAKGNNIILVDGENSGEVFTVPHDGYMGSTFKQLWISEAMHQPYVLYFIQFYKELLRNSKRGAAIPHLNKEIFYSLLIGIPPYQEQIRIARKIDIIVNEING
jgi:type I restriction-modification system, S subunit